MKAKILVLISSISLTCATVPVWAQAQMSDDGKALRDRDETRSQGIQPLGDLRRANQIIGEDIKDNHDQKVGKVKDLALDLENGRIAEVIVATGGIPGVDEKFTAVPPECFVCDRTGNTLRLRVDPEQLKNAPEFKMSDWKKSTDQSALAEAYQRFGTEPYFFAESLKLPDVTNQRGQVSHYYNFNGQNALPRLGYITRASRLLGTTARNRQDEKLGTVNNLVIDLPAGRIVEIILAEGGFLGMNRELSAVPPQAFQWNADYTAITLDTSKEAFKAAPHFNSSQWGYAYEPSSVAEVYHNYKVTPYFVTTGLGSAAQNVRERSDDGVTALEQGNATDVSVTERIRTAIQGNAALSADVSKITIVTVDGKVTLRGPVSSDEEKRMIGEAAAKVVSPDKVDNQLEIKPAPASVDTEK